MYTLKLSYAIIAVHVGSFVFHGEVYSAQYVWTDTLICLSVLLLLNLLSKLNRNYSGK